MRKSFFWLAVMLLFAVVAMAGDSTNVETKAKQEAAVQIQKVAGDSMNVETKTIQETAAQIKKATGDTAKGEVKAVPETPAQVKKVADDTAKGEVKAVPETPGQVKKAAGDTAKVEGKGKAEAPGQVKKEAEQKMTEPVKAGTPKGTETKVQTSKSGLQIIDKVVGSGAEAVKGDQVEVHYTGWLWENGKKGTKFDSSRDKGTPLSFKLGIGKVIKGWDEGVAGMKVGGTRELIIPPALAYGSRAVAGVIPPNSTLMFEVELLSVTKGQ